VTTELGLGPYKQGIAEHFDARTDYSRSETHARLADALVRLAAPQPGERVLDIASGTGFVATRAARLVGPRGRVVAVDISAGMLGQAAQALADQGIVNVELVLADAEALDYPAASFDLVVCCNALPYMADVPAALKTWAALLRPGGRLAFNCWGADSYATGHLLRQVARRHGIHVSVVGPETGTPEECRALLTSTGFAHTDVRAEPTAAYFSADQLQGMPEMAATNPLYGIAPLDASRLVAVREEYLNDAFSARVRAEIAAEVGAYFVLARK
jgi:ubiquinone/menaquinone biosynthesis C-methylase UbiE